MDDQHSRQVAHGDAARTTLGLGAGLAGLAVGLGAFGAHGLEGALEGAADAADRLGWWQTAAHYHLVHAVALVALGAASAVAGLRLRLPVRCLTAGILVFAGSLYAMALGAPRWFGAITPIGGALFIVGWTLVAVQALRRSAGREGAAPPY